MDTVVYTREDGRTEVRLVPQGSSPALYGRGILLGPPDLSSLPLAEEAAIRLNNEMVRRGWLRWTDLSGQRAALLGVVQSLLKEATLEHCRAIRHDIMVIFQNDYYFKEGGQPPKE